MRIKLVAPILASLLAGSAVAAPPVTPPPPADLGQAPVSQPAVATDQSAAGSDQVDASQVSGPGGGSAAPPQVSASGPGVRVPSVEGKDRCDPAEGKPPPECAHILDQRAGEFAHQSSDTPSAEQVLLQTDSSASPSDTSDAVRRLGGPEASDANAATALDATIGGNRSVPNVTNAAAPTLPSSVTGALNQAGVGAGTVTNTAPPP